MGLFSDNPVLEREVRGRLRLRRKGAGRAIPIVAWPIGLVALYFYARGLAAIGHGTSRDAQELLPFLVYGALTLIVLLAPALASTAITQEREQQTWDALATTRLSAWEILCGKWVGRQLIPWLMIVLSFPYLLACTVRGEVGATLLPATLVFLVVTTAFYSALGLLCSFQARRTAGATATALTVTALLCVGTPIVNSVLQLLKGWRAGPNTMWANPYTLIMWANPFFAFSALLNWLDPSQAIQGSFSLPADLCPQIVGSYLFVSVVAIAAALRFMASRYHRAVRERA